MLTNKSLSLASTRSKPYPHAHIATTSRKLAPVGQGVCVKDGVVTRRLLDWEGSPEWTMIAFLYAECPFLAYDVVNRCGR